VSETDGIGGVRSGGMGGAADFSRPLDVEDAWKKRFNGGAGHGTLGDTRRGFVRLQRKAWDDLMALQRAGAFKHQDVVILVGLLTRSGFRPDRMGVVLGNDVELAEALGVHRNRLPSAFRAAQALDIIEPLMVGKAKAGWRFSREAWQWLAGPSEHPAPDAVRRRLSAPAGASRTAPEDWPDPFEPVS
jgi:hypothetical protein